MKLDIEELLATRFRSPWTVSSENEHDHLQTLARVMAGLDEPAVRAKATSLLASNPDLAEAVLLSADRPRRDHESAIWPLAWLGGAIAALISVSLLLISPGEEQPSLTPKGMDDRVEVAAQRGPDRFRLGANERLAAGDRLGFFYSAERPGHLMLLAVDEEGTVTTLHPGQGELSAPIQAGQDVSLPDGAVADEGRGCEWIVAVFSDRPLTVRDVHQRIQSAPRGTTDCTLEPRILDARSVRVLPLRR
jgi:hypothetical protein